MDGQGPERARPYLEAAGATYTSAIDAEGVTGRLYGFKTVANGFLIDERGVLAFSKINGFDLRRPELSRLIEHWVETSETLPFTETDDQYLAAPRGAASSSAMGLYRRGLDEYRKGDRTAAAALMREALRHDPDNIIIHRHAWAIENPERFYDGPIDQSWKREQLRRGR